MFSQKNRSIGFERLDVLGRWLFRLRLAGLGFGVLFSPSLLRWRGERGFLAIEDKLLPCIFWQNISCEHRKSTKAQIMVRCWRCREFRRFVREMDKSDARLMDEIEKEGGASG
jgi:hypothetical protein